MIAGLSALDDELDWFEAHAEARSPRSGRRAPPSVPALRRLSHHCGLLRAGLPCGAPTRSVGRAVAFAKISRSCFSSAAPHPLGSLGPSWPECVGTGGRIQWNTHQRCARSLEPIHSNWNHKTAGQARPVQHREPAERYPSVTASVIALRLFLLQQSPEGRKTLRGLCLPNGPG